MLKIYNLNTLTKQEVENLLKRNTDNNQSVQMAVENIISQVKLHGDTALFYYAEQFDQITLNRLYIEKDELDILADSVGKKERQAIDTAYKNIKKFHETQLRPEERVETMPGVTCWREMRAIEKVGLYIPGGTAVLPSTFLMLGIPARLAGCKEIIVCSPPQKTGKVNSYLAYCAQLLNIDRIYLAGGAQAIAAMACGTESIAKVDKIFGPGNQYVTRAKQIIQSATQTAIDMPAGPSEVLVIADGSANPVFVAADLLAQTEHGIDSQVILVSTSNEIIDKIITELGKQLPVLERSSIATEALSNSYAMLAGNLEECINFSNQYAPEHLILATDQWNELIPNISNAGSVFLGHLTPESAGDYASGTNHTLPTSSYAKAYSGVSVDSFIKKITFQHINNEGIQNLGPAVEVLAEIEGLQAHKNAMTVRFINSVKHV